MSAFWAAAAAMVALALALVVPPLMGRGRAAGVARRELNVAIFQDRLAELERDLADGVIDEAHYREARAELERDLLEDVAGAEPEERLRRGGVPWAGVVVALVVPALAGGLYWRLGAPQLAAGTAPPPQAAGDMTIEQMVARLAERLQRQPDDGEGWRMLGRSYLVMGRFPEAVEAYRRAQRLLGDEPQVLVGLAQSLARVNGDRLVGEPERLLRRALEREPANTEARLLAGFAAFQRGGFAEAVRHWEQVQSSLPPGSEAAKVVADYLAQARARLGGAEGAPAAAAAAVVEVQVRLAEALRDKVRPDDTVFVFARAPDGPPMPLAVKRLRVRDLPAQVRLDDGDAMTPQARLSQYGEVIVGARVSRSGEARARSGDLQGSAGVVRPGQGPVTVVIDQEVL
ncbi:c-type cytochrome biogenesis protein CcmI [Inmirania thermothiophila]|uniref:Cytochrome c-type biogenesis protein CcmH n=1 Tax=Inmirania thermothiophila TaxID=1750597 RepID=A0A3N1XS75_9GAMM|nr:c-type cytochrome biogenesis protein CcmI [Inmirania thermothiophila]ROR29486.1 cytochrome c-type biogenesis protein CcmH [Inmirania thermothiophila]